MPSSQLSNIPWRKEGIRYANNEAYFDCIEELDAIIDKNGSVITCEIQGYVRKINGCFPKDFFCLNNKYFEKKD